MTVSYMMILEPLLWVGLHWKIYVGCGWGPRIFSSNTQDFAVHPTRSAKPLRWRTFIHVETKIWLRLKLPYLVELVSLESLNRICKLISGLVPFIRIVNFRLLHRLFCVGLPRAANELLT